VACFEVCAAVEGGQKEAWKILRGASHVATWHKDFSERSLSTNGFDPDAKVWNWGFEIADERPGEGFTDQPPDQPPLLFLFSFSRRSSFVELARPPHTSRRPARRTGVRGGTEGGRTIA
jgi:hypothetical protein